MLMDHHFIYWIGSVDKFVGVSSLIIPRPQRLIIGSTYCTTQSVVLPYHVVVVVVVDGMDTTNRLPC